MHVGCCMENHHRSIGLVSALFVPWASLTRSTNCRSQLDHSAVLSSHFSGMKDYAVPTIRTDNKRMWSMDYQSLSMGLHHEPVLHLLHQDVTYLNCSFQGSWQGTNYVFYLSLELLQVWGTSLALEYQFPAGLTQHCVCFYQSKGHPLSSHKYMYISLYGTLYEHIRLDRRRLPEEPQKKKWNCFQTATCVAIGR